MWKNLRRASGSPAQSPGASNPAADDSQVCCSWGQMEELPTIVPRINFAIVIDSQLHNHHNHDHHAKQIQWAASISKFSR